MKTRNRKLTHPRKPKLVREWDDEATGWSYCLWQTPAGGYIVTGSDGESMVEESGETIKAALAATRATPAEVDALLQVEE